MALDIRGSIRSDVDASFGMLVVFVIIIYTSIRNIIDLFYV